MKNVLMYMVFIMIILLMMMLLLFLISSKSLLDREKSSPFECGFDPLESSRIPFSSHFFLIAVVFLIFDVELVIIMPMMFSINMVNSTDLYMIMGLFLVILILGLYHEWYNKMLDWM
nr:NADH dehydrogenase subunit 3 [Cryptotympana atrata]